MRATLLKFQRVAVSQLSPLPTCVPSAYSHNAC
jgi:hypothetical protein